LGGFFMPVKKTRGAKQTSPITIAARIKAARAMELRMDGLSFPEIAAELKYNSRQAAHDAVMRAIDGVTREPVERLKTLDLERLDKLWQIQFMHAQAGDVQALAACMKIMERRARLLGMDAPVKQEVTGKDGGPVQQQHAHTSMTAEEFRQIAQEVAGKF